MINKNNHLQLMKYGLIPGNNSINIVEKNGENNSSNFSIDNFFLLKKKIYLMSIVLKMKMKKKRKIYME